MLEILPRPNLAPGADQLARVGPFRRLVDYARHSTISKRVVYPMIITSMLAACGGAGSPTSTAEGSSTVTGTSVASSLSIPNSTTTGDRPGAPTTSESPIPTTSPDSTGNSTPESPPSTEAPSEFHFGPIDVDINYQGQDFALATPEKEFFLQNQILEVIAFQKGISVAELRQSLNRSNGRISIQLPEANNAAPPNSQRLDTLTAIQASSPVEVDLNQGILLSSDESLVPIRDGVDFLNLYGFSPDKWASIFVDDKGKLTIVVSEELSSSPETDGIFYADVLESTARLGEIDPNDPQSSADFVLSQIVAIETPAFQSGDFSQLVVDMTQFTSIAGTGLFRAV